MQLAENKRIESIDLLRGLVMVIMALDHVRDYFHRDGFLFDPTDLEQTNGFLFFTRWITHFCAPVFVLLSGTSAYLVGERKGKKALSWFLASRGVWLILLELTIINFAWFFDPGFNNLLFIVIWVIGLGMLFLAGLIWLPLNWIAFIGLSMIFGHNLLDGITVSGQGINAILWSFLHQFQIFEFENISLFIGYPAIPWVGVMAVGYVFGKLYSRNTEKSQRKNWLLFLGASATFGFVILRALNIYGDPNLWSAQESALFTLLSFLNTSKYPPSLLYLLMTLGPAFLLLRYLEFKPIPLQRPMIIIGRVPLFYYIVHLYLIHALAMLAAVLTGFPWQAMILPVWVNFAPDLVGYGFSLSATWLIWLAIVVMLYPLCVYWDKFKTRNKNKWWVGYV